MLWSLSPNVEIFTVVRSAYTAPSHPRAKPLATHSSQPQRRPSTSEQICGWGDMNSRTISNSVLIANRQECLVKKRGQLFFKQSASWQRWGAPSVSNVMWSPGPRMGSVILTHSVHSLVDTVGRECGRVRWNDQVGSMLVWQHDLCARMPHDTSQQAR